MSAAEQFETTGKAPPTLGSYRLIQPLGSGGMSSVFRAMHLESGHEVAVKVLPRTLARNPTLLQRFIREAKNAESLEHPNIAAIYDRGFDGGRHYLVLEFVAGGDLHERVRAGGPLPVAEAVRVIRSAAEGLDYASGRGVIHRDVKPANLLLTPEGRVKIIDLGLALQAESEDERVTRDGTTVGTVDYMAPEQARDSRATSERSDIYSLGCTLYFLLTGSAPYPGGDVPDKLGRHCTAAVPDVRGLRPEVSEPLARLIKRMMAKKPEARYLDYMKLIAALDALPEARGDSGASLDALIADDEDDGPVDALIADDDEADEIGLAPADGDPPKSARPLPILAAPDSRKPDRLSPIPARETGPAEVSLAMLAGIEDEDSGPPARGRARMSSPARPAEEDFFAVQGARPAPRPSSKDVPLSTWVAAGAVLGLTIALLGFGVIQLLAPTKADPIVTSPDGGQGVTAEEVSPPVMAPLVVRPIGPPAVAKKVTPPPVTAPAWAEPFDNVAAPPKETSYAAEIEAASLPEWARRPIAPVAEGPTVTVRRIPIASDTSDVATLREALDRNGGVIEIADDGPFFEDDLRIAGKARLIRARAGFRPMIVIGPSATPLVRDRGAVLALDGARLILKGVDLVVDARALPQPLTALFHLKGAELTLDQCTVTILNTAQHPFILVRVDEPTDQRPIRGSLVRVEESLIRGASPSVVDMSGPGDLVVIRSLIVGGSDAVIIYRPTTPRGDRRYYFARSLVASRGSILELPGGRVQTPQVRAIGSTFAKVVGLDGSGLIHSRAELPGPATTAIDWSGNDNAYVGWPSFLDVGERATVVVPNLTAARDVWKGTDASSRESRRGWPIDDLATPSAMASLDEARPAILARVAEPHPSLVEATVGAYSRLNVPEIPGRTPSGVRGGGAIPTPVVVGQPLQPGVNASIASSSKTPPSFRPPASQDRSPGSVGAVDGGGLTLDLADPSWRGDLGLFLSRKVSAGASHVVVKVVGTGTWPMTPVRLPDGASVSIEATSANGPGPAWVPVPGSVAPALLEVRGGDLSLTGLTLAWAPSSNVSRLVRVEDGHLILSRCVLKSGETAMPAASGLVVFRAAGTRPLPPRAWPFLSPTDRPSCVLADCVLAVVGGEAIGAELGRGVVSMVNTAILARGEGVAIALRPQKVARSRFEADLALDHCSIASGRSFVEIGPLPGAAPGPSRPWLVSSTRSAFFEVAERGRRGAVLLRSLGDGLAHGALAWQANGDGYDLAHFTAAGTEDPPPGRQRPDVKALWIDFWGPRHILNVVGPNPRKPEANVLTRDRLRPDGLNVDDLRLDPKAHPDLGVDLGLLPAGSARPVILPF